LIWWPFQRNVVAAAEIVIPRSRSSSRKSMTVLPSWTSPTLCVKPGVIEKPLGRGRLPGIDVRDDPDVADVVERLEQHAASGRRPGR